MRFFALAILLAASVAEGTFLGTTPVKVKTDEKVAPAKPVIATPTPVAKPAETKTTAKVEAKPVVAKVETKPVVALAKPVAPKPAAKVETKPVVAKPVETKAAAKVETKPVVAVAKPVAPKEVETKPVVAVAKPEAPKTAAKVETKPVIAKPVETKPVVAVAQPVAPKKVETKPVVAAATAVAATAPHAFIANHAQGQTTPHEHAVAAQKSADEAATHLAAAKAAFQKTKANVKEILKTGKKIENTAGDIKTLYTPEEEAKAAKPPAKKEAPPPAPTGPAFELPAGFTTQNEGGQGHSYRVIAQFIWALLYYLLVVKHYPLYRELPSGIDNKEARELQAVNEIEATMHTSFPNLFLSWCCSGPRAAHTFYSTLGFNYWLGCSLMTCFPCCMLWYMNSFTRLNERLGGEKRSAIMGLFCACLCSCCVIAQDAETLDRINGVETGLCGVTRRGNRLS